MADDQTTTDIQILPGGQVGKPPGNTAAGQPAGQTPVSQPPADQSMAASTTSSAASTQATGQAIQSPATLAKAGTIILQAEALTNSGMTMTPADQYVLPDLVRQKFPDLGDLIKSTESMNQEERDYWFQILPIMTEDQIARFREILLNEKNQLAKIDKEYEQELTKLNEKHMLEWKEFEAKEKKKAIQSAEAANEEQEKQEEQELLARLASIQ